MMGFRMSTLKDSETLAMILQKLILMLIQTIS